MIQNKLFSFIGFPILFIWIVFTLISCTKTQPVTLKLWYAHPATNWMTSALPIGNGELGAMFLVVWHTSKYSSMKRHYDREHY